MILHYIKMFNLFFKCKMPEIFFDTHEKNESKIIVKKSKKK